MTRDFVQITRLPGETKPTVRIITSGDIGDCPQMRMDVKHYNDDGSCKCPNIRVVWSRYNPNNVSPKRDDLWEKIAKVAEGAGLSGSYIVLKILRRVKPGTKSKQWCARVKVTPKKKR
jgi:hypothetical protein